MWLTERRFSYVDLIPISVIAAGLLVLFDWLF